MKTLLVRNKTLILYGIALAALLFVLKWLELKFIIYDHATEIYTAFIALMFTALGIWLALKLSKPKVETVIVEKTIYADKSADFVLNEKELASLGLSPREREVLQGMAQGLSNEEIAAQLFVSVNTIKTHSSRLFEKLEVKRRTQAVDKAKRLRLIP